MTGAVVSNDALVPDHAAPSADKGPEPDPPMQAEGDPRGAPRASPSGAEPPRTSFTAFYRESYQGVAKALAYTLGNTDLAVEAADEGMARAYLHWSTVQDYANPAGWAYRVGLNWARSVHRRLRRGLPFRPVTEVNQPPIFDPAVERALQALDHKLRAVVVCRLLLDWSVEDTAEALGVRPGTVKSRLHRAMQILQTRLHHLR